MLLSSKRSAGLWMHYVNSVRNLFYTSSHFGHRFTLYWDQVTAQREELQMKVAYADESLAAQKLECKRLTLVKTCSHNFYFVTGKKFVFQELNANKSQAEKLSPSDQFNQKLKKIYLTKLVSPFFLYELLFSFTQGWTHLGLSNIEIHEYLVCVAFSLIFQPQIWGYCMYLMFFRGVYWPLNF